MLFCGMFLSHPFLKSPLNPDSYSLNKEEWTWIFPNCTHTRHQCVLQRTPAIPTLSGENPLCSAVLHILLHCTLESWKGLWSLYSYVSILVCFCLRIVNWRQRNRSCHFTRCWSISACFFNKNNRHSQSNVVIFQWLSFTACCFCQTRVNFFSPKILCFVVCVTQPHGSLFISVMWSLHRVQTEPTSLSQPTTLKGLKSLTWSSNSNSLLTCFVVHCCSYCGCG